MKKRNLKSLHLRKNVISNLKIDALKGQLRRGSDDPNCSGDTAIIYTCHETCNNQER
ncbi:hypothetical protein H2O64_20310 [Kordia sp. YSTF-M3]|uniref:Uncharacterized protein n=1 Tax=Kordia aestuariivivens TaxID=2759037 RepID=A0ABR7QEQ5_9FLAO|nr:hypothetical protein [Kordia aestuariivivens]MBC8757027.1 hypothetical protein [Kordia aestuariivivens]